MGNGTRKELVRIVDASRVSGKRQWHGFEEPNRNEWRRMASLYFPPCSLLVVWGVEAARAHQNPRTSTEVTHGFDPVRAGSKGALAFSQMAVRRPEQHGPATLV